MKLCLKWINDYCKVTARPEEIARLLTMAGLELKSMETVLGDVRMELDVTANRTDCLSIIGIAREVAALTGGEARLPELPCPARSTGSAPGYGVEVLDQKLCPRYTARLVRGVKIQPSPLWMQERIEAVGIRSINNIVDITNFILMEVGQPLHAFDLLKLNGPRIIVRRAEPGEKITAIDGREYELNSDNLVIADASAPVAVAGVMGGLASEVSDTTRDVLIESAMFDPVCIRRASRRLGLSSESSYRFERGVSFEGVEWASQRAAALMAELAGGAPDDILVDISVQPPAQKKVPLRMGRLELLLGCKVDRADVLRILTALGFKALSQSADSFEFIVPSFRSDVGREADLIEEVARVNGYDKIPVTLDIPLALARRNKLDEVNDRTREVLAGCGMFEVLTTSFGEPSDAGDFTFWSEGAAVALTDPFGNEAKHLRKSMVPAFLAVERINQPQASADAIFEVAKVYFSGAGKAKESLCLGMLCRSGLRPLKGFIETLFERLGLSGKYQFVESQMRFLAQGESVCVRLFDEVIGYAGAVSAALAEKHDLRTAPAICELDFEKIVAHARLDRMFSEFSRQPAVQRDMVVLFAERVKWDQIEQCIAGTKAPALESVKFFDIYRGKQIPAGHKSVGFSVVFRAQDRTLTHEEVDAAMAKIVGALDRELGGRLRDA
jgi:phenylalanyl-tRNA synthetase beta chain